MASSSKDINMPAVIILTVCGFLLLGAGIELARGLYAMQIRGRLAVPAEAGQTLTPQSADLYAAQEKNLHADPKRVSPTGEPIAFQDIDAAMAAEIAAVKPR